MLQLMSRTSRLRVSTNDDGFDMYNLEAFCTMRSLSFGNVVWRGNTNCHFLTRDLDFFPGTSAQLVGRFVFKMEENCHGQVGGVAIVELDGDFLGILAFVLYKIVPRCPLWGTSVCVKRSGLTPRPTSTDTLYSPAADEESLQGRKSGRPCTGEFLPFFLSCYRMIVPGPGFVGLPFPTNLQFHFKVELHFFS